MTTKNFFQEMSDGMEVCVNRWIPETDPKAIILISHGMAEHSLRYDRIASYFTDAGFLVSAHDHRGHGRTAQKQAEKGEPGFGYLADKKGAQRVKDDILEISKKLREDFPGKKIVVLSHSFGSMIIQSLIEQDTSFVDLCILSGTRGPMQTLVGSGLVLARIMYLLGQKKRTANLLDFITFNSYNKKIENKRTNFDWLSKDNFIVDMYLADQWCGFKMKNEFFYELLSMLSKTHKKSNMKKISLDLPILFTSGKDDPVGSYGKTVENLYNIYKSNGIKDVELKLYDNDRHEIFNETDSETVIKDVIDWINKRI